MCAFIKILFLHFGMRNKETNLNTDFYFQKYYFVLLN